MNRKHLSLLSLLCITSLSILNARDRVESLARIKKAHLEAIEQYKPVEKQFETASQNLLQTPAGKNYETALSQCSIVNNCKDCDIFQQALAELQSTKEYQEDYLPIHLSESYWGMKKLGLAKMIRYVNAGVDKNDIEAMYSGIHSALYVDSKVTSESSLIREQVREELQSLVKEEQEKINALKNSKQ